MQSFITSLTKLGLSNTESRVYAALVPINNSKASKIAKEVGISRAQVYPVLENLMKKFFVRKIEFKGSPTVFKAVPLTEILHGIKIRQEQEFDSLFDKLTGDYDRLLVKGQERSKENPEVIMYTGWSRVIPLIQEELLASSESIMMILEPLVLEKFATGVIEKIITTKNVQYPSFSGMISIKDLKHYTGLSNRYPMNLEKRYSISFDNQFEPFSLNYIIIDKRVAIILEGDKKGVFALYSTHPALLRAINMGVTSLAWLMSEINTISFISTFLSLAVQSEKPVYPDPEHWVKITALIEKLFPDGLRTEEIEKSDMNGGILIEKLLSLSSEEKLFIKDLAENIWKSTEDFLALLTDIIDN